MAKWRPSRGRYTSRVVQAAKKINPEETEQAGKKLVDASKNVNRGKRARISNNSKPEYQKVFVQPMVSQSQPSPTINISQASSAEPILEAKEIEMPVMRTTRVPIKSSTNPFINVNQSIQNAYDSELPGLQRMFEADRIMMHAPLMQRLVDRTGRTAQSISKQINPETGAIYTNYFDVVEPNYAQWRKLHSMTKGTRPTEEEAGKMFQTPQMKTIFSRMQNLLGINPVEAKQVTIRKPYSSPQTNVASNYIGPDMGSGLYGYDASTSEWRPLATVAVEHSLGKPDTYSMFGQIGQSPIKFNSNDIIENGVNFEGDPFTVIQNKPIEQKIRTFNPFWGRQQSNDFNPLWGRKPDYLKQGGILSAKSGIHIKKANRGKFTDYCGGKVTSACIAKGKASSNPTIRKRATFAANARKWKHQNGGIIPNWMIKQINKNGR